MIPLGRQSPQHPGYVGADVAYDCTQCVGYWAKEAHFPDLQPIDREAWGLMLLLQDQQRVGFEPIGLDYSVLPAVFDLEGVPPAQRPFRFHQLVALNHAFQAYYAEKREADKNKKPPRGGGGRG